MLNSYKEIKINRPISVLHVAMEGGTAVFGGLGRVATQMVEAQNRYHDSNAPEVLSNIITPYYPNLHSTYTSKRQIAKVQHAYADRIITSSIYMVQDGNHRHYLVEPPPEYKYLFNINSLPEIYGDTEHSYFIERVKLFNSCVAAYVNLPSYSTEHPNPNILQLHDWQSALVPKLLKDVYRNSSVKSVFMIHIDSGDRGSYPSSALEGIGLKFTEGICILKTIGFINSDKIVAVSPKFLRECIESPSDNAEIEFTRKVLAWAAAQNKTAGIGNGINYNEYCPLGKYIQNLSKISAEKAGLKHEIANELCGSRLLWRFDPHLPLILYVGRYSPEKGSEVFSQVIAETTGRATFVAVGRGMTEDVFKAMITHSRQTDNVFITASEKEQAQLIERLRAAADIVLIPSHRDAFGLVGPEGLANGAVIVTTGVGGLKDVVEPLNINDPNNTFGNGIFYEDLPDGGHNADLSLALDRALRLWSQLSPDQLSTMQARIMLGAKKFDWLATNGALHQYTNIYKELLQSNLMAPANPSVSAASSA